MKILSKISCVVVLAGLAQVALHAPPASANGNRAESTVTIPLDSYLSLIKPKEDVSITTIESASLTGEFGEKLRLRIMGTSVGHATPQPVLQSSPQFMISKCSGTANVVNRDRMISVLAKDKKFQVDCELAVKSWGELIFNFSDVLFVASDVAGADSSVEGARVVIHRKLKELTGTAAEVTVTGRYQISVLPESTKFSYHFDIHNPNRAKKPYVLTLANGESVTQVETAAEYKELDHGKISFNLGPGANRVQINGALGTTKWKAPVTGALQYLMIQNKPMVQLKVETTAKRISNEDSRMPASFSSSRTYLLDPKSVFSWDVKKLEVIASTGYSVGQALYNMYVPDEGPGIVEAQFSIQNRGTPELALKIPGKPVYLEIDSQPQVLAVDADGNLLTQIANGDHQLLVQYKTAKPFGGWVSNINEMMIHPATALSNVSVNVGFAKSWSAVFGTVLTDYFNRFPIANLLTALFATLLLLGFFKGMSFKKETKGALLALTFVLHILKPGLFYFTFFALAIMLFFHHRSRMGQYFDKQSKWRNFGMAFGAILAVLFLYTYGGDPTRSSYEDVMLAKTASMEMASPPMPVSNYGGGMKGQGAARTRTTAGKSGLFSNLAAAPPPSEAAGAEMADMAALDEGAVSGSFAEEESGEDFKGLPAKIRIPAAAQNISFSQGLVDEKASPSIKLLVINPKVFYILEWLIIAALLFVVYRERKQFVTYLRLG